jgi:V/A-type H+-transporting ATPase subunit I
MAEGVFRSAPLLVGVIGFLFVVLIGHSLNLVMSLLSVIVHGIRLNILEFSNQLGMEWSGYKYDPFRETVKEN